MDLSLSRFERALDAHRSKSRGPAGRQRSAVAVLLSFARDTPEVLLMKRIERPGDRWSGQVSLPGGRESPTDVDLRATAERETHEEVGLDLASIARPIGQLDTIRARARGLTLSLTITPFVYVQTRPAEPEPGYEAQSVFWLPLDRAASGALDDDYRYSVGPVPLTFRCWRYQDYVVWGLTYRMLGHLLDVVAASD